MLITIIVIAAIVIIAIIVLKPDSPGIKILVERKKNTVILVLGRWYLEGKNWRGYNELKDALGGTEFYILKKILKDLKREKIVKYEAFKGYYLTADGWNRYKILRDQL